MATPKPTRIATWTDETAQRLTDPRASEPATLGRREATAGTSEDKAAAKVASVSQATVPVVSIIGLGYVGVVSAGCLSARGFKVLGADLDTAKVAAVSEGRSPIVERGLEPLLAEGVKLGRISASVDVVAAVAASDVTLLSVGTPTSADGGCDLTYVRAASRSIGAAIKNKPGYHCVILRCSVPPGTTLAVAVPEIEAASGKTLGAGFGICFSPEFLREGTAVADFADPPKVVIAASDKRTEAMARRVLSLPGQRVLITSMAAAETLKYVDNVWHATKVVFANEVGRFCKSLDVDSHEVMRLFVEDTKLNLSPYYLKPGFAFGGSCLPKEVRAAMHIGARNGLQLPLIDSLLASNEQQIAEAHELITKIGGQTVGMLGLAFKSGTDDLRESPMVELMARLVSDGRTVRVADPSLAMGPRLSAQIGHIRKANPALAPALDALEGGHALQSTATVLQTCDVIVIAHATDAFRQAVLGRRASQHVVDLARLFLEVPAQDTYHGLSW
jgi:GDP-mannose 6-dehydrogenase